MMSKGKFNIRVYGIVVQEGQVLLSHEVISGMSMTKFPGGGLEYGEGPLDTLKREFQEELQIQIDSANHFYTTDFYQQSAFDSNQQIISIYYRVLQTSPPIPADLTPFNHLEDNQREQFEWHSIAHLDEGQITFPIDKIVLNLLKETES